jgi:hypothetical protein
MKKNKKALHLNKETIRNLAPDEMPRVGGGAGTLYCTELCTYACPTQHCSNNLRCTTGCPQ